MKTAQSRKVQKCNSDCSIAPFPRRRKKKRNVGENVCIYTNTKENHEVCVCDNLKPQGSIRRGVGWGEGPQTTHRSGDIKREESRLAKDYFQFITIYYIHRGHHL